MYKKKKSRKKSIPNETSEYTNVRFDMYKYKYILMVENSSQKTIIEETTDIILFVVLGLVQLSTLSHMSPFFL